MSSDRRSPSTARRRRSFYEDEHAAEPEWERFEDHLQAGRLLARRFYLDEGIDSDSARTFRSWTDAMLGRGSAPITIVINTPGGEVVAGMDIVSQIRALQRSGVEVIGHVMGDAASMGAVILAACSVRSMTSLSRLMWHGIVSFSFGDATDMKIQRRELDRMTASIAAILTASAKPNTRFNNRTWVRKVMSEKRPSYIYPEEALLAGLVDEVVE